MVTIKNHPDYLVNELGDVFSMKSGSLKKLKIQKYPNGYAFVTLSTNKIQNGYMIHRIVAEAFIPNPENKNTVNHKDGNKLNNCIENLEWATMGENNKHAYKTGLRKHHKCWSGKKGLEHNKSKEVIEFDLNGKEINRYGSAREAAKIIGISFSAIQQRCTGLNRPIKGKTYQYAVRKF